MVTLYGKKHLQPSCALSHASLALGGNDASNACANLQPKSVSHPRLLSTGPAPLCFLIFLLMTFLVFAIRFNKLWRLRSARFSGVNSATASLPCLRPSFLYMYRQWLHMALDTAHTSKIYHCDHTTEQCLCRTNADLVVLAWCCGNPNRAGLGLLHCAEHWCQPSAKGAGALTLLFEYARLDAPSAQRFKARCSKKPVMHLPSSSVIHKLKRHVKQAPHAKISKQRSLQGTPIDVRSPQDIRTHVCLNLLCIALHCFALLCLALLDTTTHNH